MKPTHGSQIKFLQPINDEDTNGILSSNRGLKIQCESTSTIDGNSSSYSCEKALDHNVHSYFCSERNIPFASITFLFPKNSFVISHYTFTIPIWNGNSSEALGVGPKSFR